MTSNVIDAISPLAADIRRHDPDRHLASLFAPADRRADLLALYAFDHEIAKARWVVQEPMAGLIRLQWWRDALERLAIGDSLAHPVVEALQPIMAQKRIDKALFLEAIDAQDLALEALPPDDWMALETSFDRAHGSIVRAALALLGIEEKAPLIDIARHIGVVRGYAEAGHWLLARGVDPGLRLPTSVLQHHGIDPSLPSSMAVDRTIMKAVHQTLIERGRAALRRARAPRRPSIPTKAVSALLPGMLAFSRLESGFSPRPMAPLLRPLNTLWLAIRGRY